MENDREINPFSVSKLLATMLRHSEASRRQEDESKPLWSEDRLSSSIDPPKSERTTEDLCVFIFFTQLYLHFCIDEIYYSCHVMLTVSWW